MRLHTLFFAATLVASSSTALAGPITRLFVFGDSVSDNGNLAALSGGTLPAPPYAPGRASDAGRVYAFTGPSRWSISVWHSA